MDKDLILLGHGSGGVLSHKLLADLIIPTLSGTPLANQDDAATITLGEDKLAFTTDSYVVDPLFFPGGDIGSLAVNGTINDLAMVGARPLFLSVGLIIEEGFSRAKLTQVLASMRQAADAAGVKLITGDTKVVPRGKADKLFVNTTGIGVVAHGLSLGGAQARPGDLIIVSGTIGDHGIAVMASREGLALSTPVWSDCAALNGLVDELLAVGRDGVHVLRDPTRGGLATTLKEIALQAEVTITLDEAALPVAPAVQGVCAILGLDPLYVANEGKLVACVAPDVAEQLLETIRQNPLGGNAAIIGEVKAAGGGRVRMKTAAGGMRAVEMLAGEQLPRIC